MREAVIVSTARTPIGKAYRGAFNNTSAQELGGHAIRSAVERAKIDAAEVEDVIVGAALQQGVSASTAVGFLVQMAGLMLAGQMDRIGLSSVLLVQAGCLAAGALAMGRISPAPPPEQAGPRESALKTIAAGFRAARSRAGTSCVRRGRTARG